MESAEPGRAGPLGPAASRPSSAPRLLVGFLAAVVTLTGFVLWNRKPGLPKLTRDRLTAARAAWAEANVADYDVRVEVQGRQAAVYEVQMRGHEVRRATRNGEPLKSRRTMGTWSVPGMFATLESDLVHQEAVEAGRATGTTPLVELRAEFEPQYGYPLRCQRIQSGGPGANPEVFWEVKSFVIRAP